MSRLLDGFEHIDFFSLDVEGSELVVVSTLDFEKISVDTFCIELDEHDPPPKNRRVENLLAQKGYQRCVVPGSSARNGCFRKKC